MTLAFGPQSALLLSLSPWTIILRPPLPLLTQDVRLVNIFDGTWIRREPLRANAHVFGPVIMIPFGIVLDWLFPPVMAFRLDSSKEEEEEATAHHR